MEIEEQSFEQLVPVKSVLGREFQSLKKERQKQQDAFERSTDKMGYETSPYRMANLATERFIREWLPRVERAYVVLGNQAKENMLNHESATLRWEFGLKTPVDRRTEARIWQHFALSRYRDHRQLVSRCKIYQPNLVDKIRKAWRHFRKESMIWKYGGTPWDGSRAMHAMLDFILQVDLLAAVND